MFDIYLFDMINIDTYSKISTSNNFFLDNFYIRYLTYTMKYITSLSSTKAILEGKQDKEEKSNLKQVKRLILIGELYLNSIKLLKEEGIKTEYADSTKLDYQIEDSTITIITNEKEYPDIKLKKSDVSDTIILMRSGYTLPTVSFLLKAIEEMGFVIINKPEPVKMSSDKYLTAEFLKKNNIEQPNFVLVTHNDVSKDDHSKLDAKLKTLYKENVDDDTKYVCKILNGHGGKGVWVCRGKNITSILQCLFKLSEKTDILVQDFQTIKEGDIRVHVITINGKQEIVNSIMRKKGKDFRTNLSLGCSMEDDYKLTPNQEKLALEAAKASGLTWCGVDILPTEGKDLVVELNGAPGPSSPIDDPDIEETNHKFFTKVIETINKLVK